MEKSNKKELRKFYLSRRLDRHKRLDGLEQDHIDTQILDRTKTILEKIDYDSIMLFYPYLGEIPISKLFDSLHKTKTILFPRVVGKRKMEAVPVSNLNDFQLGYKNIMEPKGDPFVGKIGVVLTPGLCFHFHENDEEISVPKSNCQKNEITRLGYGGGFYDYFLQDNPDCYKIGVFYDFQHTNYCFGEEHDIRLDGVITEKRVYGLEKNF